MLARDLERCLETGRRAAFCDNGGGVGGSRGAAVLEGLTAAVGGERSHRCRDRLLNGLLRLLLVDAGDLKGGTIERQVGQFLLRQQVLDFFAGRELGVHRVVEVGDELVYIDGGGGDAQP